MEIKIRTRKIARYGWKPDLPDIRDHVFGLPAGLLSLPEKVDLRAEMPKVYDQGQIGSCTANAIAAAIEFDLMKQQLPNFMPSRLFIYYNERDMEHSVHSDSGAQIRDGVKSVNKLGVCDEIEWPYDPVAANPDTNLFPASSRAGHKPGQLCYITALQNIVMNYQAVTRTIAHFKACLAAGFPFVFGFTVYSSFESSEVAKTGILAMPSKNEQVVGGHAVLAVGYDNAKQVFIIRNSWGEKWGQAGYFLMPYDYLLSSKLSSDFWTLRMVK